MPETAVTVLDPGVVQLGTRRVYILPTRYGVGFAAVLVVMLIGSVNYNNSLGYLLTFLLGSAALVGLLHTWRNLFGLRVRIGAAQSAHAGGQVSVQVVLENPDPTPRPALMAYLSVAPGAGVFATRSHAPAAGQVLLRLALPAARRGRLALGSVVVASRWPLGLFRAWTVLPSGSEVLVYPRAAGRRSLPASRFDAEADGDQGGIGNEDFAGLRDYRPGDSPRHIHWKAVARERGVLVKQFAGASSAEQVLRFEDTPQGDLEGRLSQLTLWVLEAEARGLRFALDLPDEQVAAGSGDAHRDRCLRSLALFGLPREAHPA